MAHFREFIWLLPAELIKNIHKTQFVTCRSQLSSMVKNPHSTDLRPKSGCTAKTMSDLGQC